NNGTDIRRRANFQYQVTSTAATVHHDTFRINVGNLLKIFDNSEAVFERNGRLGIDIAASVRGNYHDVARRKETRWIRPSCVHLKLVDGACSQTAMNPDNCWKRSFTRRFAENSLPKIAVPGNRSDGHKRTCLLGDYRPRDLFLCTDKSRGQKEQKFATFQHFVILYLRM